MARKKIREHSAKTLLRTHLKRLRGIELPTESVQVNADTDFRKLVEDHPWMAERSLVVKPDMLFGKRGKHNLVGLDLRHDEAEVFVKGRLGKQVEVGGCSGAVDTFIVEPFVPHGDEYYLAIQSVRDGNVVLFSDTGGVEVEENWGRVRQLMVPTLDDIDSAPLGELTAGLPGQLAERLQAFIRGAFAVFDDLDFTYMEFNPLAVGPGGEPVPLDMRGELDDTAAFKNARKWGELEFPMPFGRHLSAPEAAVKDMDEVTGASLKLTILNPKGRVWSLVAGGGASVIYADTVADLGCAEELGNYGEYSGAPNTRETYLYARTVLQCATHDPDGRGRALLVGGGIANFTDVAVTFRGIIQAMREASEQLRGAKVKVFVRRGGPNYQAGLEAMRALGDEIGLPVEVFGPEATMTGICRLAIDYVRSFDWKPDAGGARPESCWSFWGT
uniref:ATP citrate synthase n=1 Tax=Tetraselmis sp. GSL018 TaxID=582737 RepID=A0A061S2C8_9CHLO|mmetsp:Transcript_9115/g.21951  ORF Transcript_9115/g.21951 Transcript_9115/m.21951 type:complete len:444 (-) Transcript_9115:131-1462(-)